MKITFAICSIAAFVNLARADDEVLTYEQHVRPILRTHCFHCHGEGDEIQAGLDLRLRRLIAIGGDSGAAISPGEPADSLLLQRIEQREMPPEEVDHRPTMNEIDMIRRWIADGAETARPEPESITDTYITQEERDFWAFQPIRRPALPPVENMDRARTPIDSYLLAKLEANELAFAPDADRRTMLRRVYLDLVGLPPTPEEAARFLNDHSPDALERLIDRLLDSPHYGERWGRHWLDVAGYADSEGYTDDDPERPFSYRYRDYVIRSFNADKPFDEFIVEQLAGDELVQPPYAELPPADVDKLVATGYLRMAPDGTGAGGVDQPLARNDVVAKTIEIVSTSLLGLTVGCAQCHNHRYDPIPQEDYYRLRAVFAPAYDPANWLNPNQRRVSLYGNADRQEAAEIEAEAKKIEAERIEKQNEYIEQTFEKELAKLPEAIRETVRAARSTAEKQRTAAQKKLLKDNPSVNVTASSLYLYDRKAADDLEKMAKAAAKLRSTKPQEVFLRALTEPAANKLPETFVFHRGDHEQPKQQVEPGELRVLCASEDNPIPANDSALPTSGRRLAYARWLTSGNHPLVARVIVNRVWLHHFGRGIVATPGDFGSLGERPSHPELLDWLASEFSSSGWSLKHLHRMIMTSTAYRQSCEGKLEYEAVDSENRWLWRMPVRRLEAEVIRDATLAVSGKLNTQRFGPPVPVMADQVGQFIIGKENLNAGRPGAVIPMNGEEFRRSIYIQARRSRPLAVLDTFDVPRMDPNCTGRTVSTVAPQSLLLMNSGFAATFSEHFARRVRDESDGDARARIRRAWLLAYCDEPTDTETNEALQFLDDQVAFFDAQANDDKTKPDPKLEALTSFCHALLSSNRFLYVD